MWQRVITDISLYTAPELFIHLPERNELTKSADYYALGIALLHLVMGNDAFGNMMQKAIFRLTFEGKVLLPEGTDDKVRRLIEGLLKVNPAERWEYEHVADWLHDKAGTGDMETTDSPETINHKMEKWHAEITKQNDRAIDAILSRIAQGLQMVEKGDLRFLPYLSALYRNEYDDPRSGIPKEVLEPLMRCFHAAAEQGDADSECNIGIGYLAGEGVAQDDDAGLYHLTRASESGSTVATRKLGDSCVMLHQDYTQATKWYLDAAEHGDLLAICFVAVMERKGLTSLHTYNQLIEWYQEAIEYDCAEATLVMGLMYCDGNIVFQDFEKALGWFQKSALLGNKLARTAMRHLVRYLADGCTGKRPSLQDYLSRRHPAAPSQNGKPQAYKVGGRVRHPKFGEGVIIEMSSGKVDTPWLKVDFRQPDIGIKKISVSYQNMN